MTQLLGEVGADDQVTALARRATQVSLDNLTGGGVALLLDALHRAEARAEAAELIERACFGCSANKKA